MSKIEYIDGKGYEIGKLYEFSDDVGFSTYRTLLLVGINFNREHRFRTPTSNWRFCRDYTGEIGKITRKPIEFVYGECYQFEVGGDAYKGVFVGHHFQSGGNDFCVSACKNIVELVPKS